MKKSFSVFAGRRLAFGPAPQAGPAKPPRAPRLGPAPRRASPACLRAPRLLLPRAVPSPRHVLTASGDARRVSATRPASSDLAARWRAWRGARPAASRTRSAVTPPALFFLPPEPRAPSSALAALELRRRRAPAPPRHSPIARARNSASPSLRSRSSLLRLPSPGWASPRLATDGHGAAVLGRRGTPPSSPSPPCLAAWSHSPMPREPRALASSPCRGRRWPPASWPSRAVAPARAHRRALCFSQPAGPARQSSRGPKPCCQAAALLLALGPRRPVAAVGQLISSGLAQ